MKRLLILCLGILLLNACSEDENNIPVIFDTDTNNELDDQHALAYLLFNSDVFDLKGITVNATGNGGDIDEQYAEAERVMKLCKAFDKVPLLRGANASFLDIKDSLTHSVYDGYEAVDFIIDEAMKYSSEQKIVLLAVGKLTNVALAVEKEPKIRDRIRLVWLGANYPEPGEYNLVNDIPSMNYLLNSEIEFEIVTVRYGKDSGTDFVQVYKKDVLGENNYRGMGPGLEQPVEGRHGGSFYNFGDYSTSLFENCQFHGEKEYRALFDMAAVAVVKNADWAQKKTIPAPIMEGEKWVERPDNKRSILLFEYFDRDAIIKDFNTSLQDYKLVE